MSDPRSFTNEQVQHYIDTLYDVVSFRLRDGAHPEDAMMTAKDLIDAWVAAHVDGCTTAVYADGHTRVPK